jgi:hypothetical protein
MISPSYDFHQFVEAVKGMKFLDIIYHADQEATRAERFIMRNRRDVDGVGESCRRYADTLKDLIFYLRYVLMPHSLSDSDSSLFHSLSESLARRKQLH